MGMRLFPNSLSSNRGLLIVCLMLISPLASGMEIRIFDKQMDLSPPRGDGRILCRQVYGPRIYGSRISSASPEGFRQHDMQFFPENQINPKEAETLAEIFQGWRESGRVTDLAALEAMQARASAGSPLRSKYVVILDGGHFSGLRITDGSTHVMNYGMSWFKDPISRSQMTLETRYGIRVPERVEGEESYIWSLELLISPHHFIQGTEAIFSNVAFLLDAHYNKMEYRVFGDLSSIEALNFQIYANAKPELVDHYREYGFEPIWMFDQTGQVQTMPDGLVLIKASGADFIRKNFYRSSHPATRSGGGVEDVQRVEDIMGQLHKMNRELRDTEMGGFKDFEHWRRTLMSFMNEQASRYEKAQTDAERQIIYFHSVRSIYLMLKSEVVTKEDPNAEVKRVFIKELLVEGHEFGWTTLMRWLSGEMNKGKDYDDSHFRFEW